MNADEVAKARKQFVIFIIILSAVCIIAGEAKAQRWGKPYVWNKPNGCDSTFELFWPAKVKETVPFEAKEFDALSPAALQYDGSNAVYCSEDEPPSNIERLPDGIVVRERVLYSQTTGGVIGKARWWWRDNEILEGDIWIKTGLGIFQVLIAQAHELGHIVGLEDHSENPDDLMYWSPITSRPSLGDLKRISKLYFNNAPIVDWQGDAYFPCISAYQFGGRKEELVSFTITEGTAWPWGGEVGEPDCK